MLVAQGGAFCNVVAGRGDFAIACSFCKYNDSVLFLEIIVNSNFCSADFDKMIKVRLTN